MPWRVSITEVGVIPDLPRGLYEPDAEPDDRFDVPCFAYLLEDGEHAVLVDSGPDAVAAARFGYRVIGDSSALLLNGLKARGVDPQNIDMVVHTHLHYDHCQNDRFFDRATVFAQKEEIEFAMAEGPFYEGATVLRTALGARLVPVTGDVELLPGIQTIFNRGHTCGHQSVLVETEEGTVCICGDIVSLQINTTVIGEVCADRDATRSFLQAARHAGWEMIPSHEPTLRAHRWFLRD